MMDEYGGFDEFEAWLRAQSKFAYGTDLAAYQDRALEAVRRFYPAADRGAFSGRYQLEVWDGEAQFVDTRAAWEYPGQWVAMALDCTADEFVQLLMDDALERLVD